MPVPLADKLAEICARKSADVAVWKDQTPWATIDAAARNAPPPRGFAKALAQKRAAGLYGLITEIKKASPSAGLIRADFDPPRLAQAYEQGGAACLSILTDTPYFQGENAFLEQARATVTLPVLRKDFMVDVWQIAEARALGADCVLLIMAVLDEANARLMHDAAVDYGMDVLIEVHNAQELERALNLPSGLIGINNRNLKTLKVDLQTTLDLAPLVPSSRVVVGESGFKTRVDLDSAHDKAKVGCFLIGESLMREADLAAATLKLAR